MLASIKPIKMSYVYKQFIFNNVKKVFTLIHSSLLHKQQTCLNETIRSTLNYILWIQRWMTHGSIHRVHNLLEETAILMLLMLKFGKYHKEPFSGFHN